MSLYRWVNAMYYIFNEIYKLRCDAFQHRYTGCISLHLHNNVFEHIHNEFCVIVV